MRGCLPLKGWAATLPLLRSEAITRLPSLHPREDTRPADAPATACRGSPVRVSQPSLVDHALQVVDQGASAAEWVSRLPGEGVMQVILSPAQGGAPRLSPESCTLFISLCSPFI